MSDARKRQRLLEQARADVIRSSVFAKEAMKAADAAVARLKELEKCISR